MGDRERTILPPDPEGLKRFEMSPERGFLPQPAPAARLPAALAPWQELAAELPKRLLAGRLGSAVRGLPLLEADAAETERDQRAAMRVLSYLAHGYVWERGEVRAELPAVLAEPWLEVAEAVGRPPVLSYASYALDNWRPLDPRGPIAAENVAILQNFLGGADEDWFIAIHVEIEALAAPALAAAGPAQTAAAEGDTGGLAWALEAVADSLEAMNGTLRRMTEHCDPFIYFHRVRPFIHGWKGQPALPHGLLYRRADGGGAHRQLRGETGAQSTIVPTLDALLGVAHGPDPLRAYLDEMRDYMPPAHRAFLEAAESGPAITNEVVQQLSDDPVLAELRETCLHWLEAFRTTHLEYAATYIHQQARGSAANPSDVGTGGTPFMPYLKKHRDETATTRRS